MEILTEKVAAPAATVLPTLNPGDKVAYVPHLCHALQQHPDGTYPWHIRKRGQKKHPLEEGEPPDEEFVNAKHLHDHLSYIRKLPPDQAQLWIKALIFVRPTTTWPATVRAVDEKTGLVSLDVQSPNPAVTLHYAVPHDPAKAAHSCHVPG